MAYGDYDGPEKPNKGKEGGACNRERCQAEPALSFNHGTSKWYCGDCARDIGEGRFNKRDWEINWRPKCGHAMFETREEIDAREAKAKTIDGQIQEIVGSMFGWPRGREKSQSASLQRLLKQGRRR